MFVLYCDGVLMELELEEEGKRTCSREEKEEVVEEEEEEEEDSRELSTTHHSDTHEYQILLLSNQFSHDGIQQNVRATDARGQSKWSET